MVNFRRVVRNSAGNFGKQAPANIGRAVNDDEWHTMVQTVLYKLQTAVQIMRRNLRSGIM